MKRALLLALLSAMVGCGDASVPTPNAHTQMVTMLREIARRAPDENPYTGSQRARALRETLRTLPAQTHAVERFNLLADSGDAELKLGNAEIAAERYAAAIQLIPGLRAQGLVPVVQEARLLYRLGIVWWLRAEQENCRWGDSSQRCILPLQGAGLHKYKTASQTAARYFLRTLSVATPEERIYHAALWLLNAAHMTLGTWPDSVPARYRIREDALTSGVPFPRFENIAPAVGLDAYDLAGGACVDDFDNDGVLDILTSTWDPVGPMHHFRRRPDGTYEDVGPRTGLAGLLGGLNVKQADYDNDGDLDVLVLRGAWLGTQGRHPNSLLRNDGRGNFEDVTLAAGLGPPYYPTQTAEWADFDGDGWIDLYVGNETWRGQVSPCQLLRNNGDGTFRDVAKSAGVENLRWTKGVTWGDYDGDGDPDLYVSNYGQENRLYRNNGDGTFEDVAVALGVQAPIASFPVWFWDFDNDGALDLYAPSYAARADDLGRHYRGLPPTFEASKLYRGDGAGGFEDVSTAAGLSAPVLPMGSNFGDLDGDGYLDFYLGTGDPSVETVMPNVMYLNRAGAGFDDVTMAGGFGHLQKGHGTAFADLDHDGDLDVFAQTGGAYVGDKFYNTLYENPGFGHAWVVVHLVGRTANRAAIGARVHLRVRGPEGERSIYRHVNSGGSFGANPLRQTIGLGDATDVVFVEVTWPGKRRAHRVSGIKPGGAYRIEQGAPGARPLTLPNLKRKTSPASTGSK